MHTASFQPKIGIIGGSGLYQMEDLEVLESVEVETPFGKPSDEILVGKLSGVSCAFLPRHGKGHRLLPSELNFRANIAALKMIGCRAILSVSAVGSLRAEIEPGHLVMVDQFIDQTTKRPSSFFGEGLVAHVGFAEPICTGLRKNLTQTGRAIGITVHPQGTYICIEGPLFSTKAESRLYQSFGADVIGMTNLQEARLSREAGMCYATIALSTDYDCWHEEHDSVTADMIIATLNKNVSSAQKMIKEVLPKINLDCACADSLKNSIITSKESVPQSTLEKLRFLLPQNYLG